MHDSANSLPALVDIHDPAQAAASNSDVRLVEVDRLFFLDHAQRRGFKASPNPVAIIGTRVLLRSDDSFLRSLADDARYYVGRLRLDLPLLGSARRTLDALTDHAIANLPH